MVRQSTRIPLVIILILFLIFNILSMVNGKGDQLQHHQCHNNYESHHRCPSSKHGTGIKRKKRSDLAPINHILLNKNHIFDTFYDNLKFDDRNIDFSQKNLHQKSLNGEGNKKSYLDELEKILGQYPQQKSVRIEGKNLESIKKFKRKSLENKNIPQVLSNFEEEEEEQQQQLPNHVRVKRANSKFKQVSSPSVSSEYLQSLAESFAGPPEAEENQDMDTQEIENEKENLQNLGNVKKRDIHQSFDKNNKVGSIKNNHHENPYVKLIRHKRYGDPDKLGIHGKNNRAKKEVINHGKNYSNVKTNHGEPSKVTKRNASKKGKKAIKHRDKKKDKKMIVERKSSSAKKNRSVGVRKNFQSGKKNKRNLEKNLNNIANRLDKLQNERKKSVREANDLNESSKSSSLEEIKNLAENLISKIDHLEESIKSHRFARHSRQASPVKSKDAH